MFSNIALDILAAYVSSLSPINLSKKKRPYFDMDLQTLNGKRRELCFSKERYITFKELDESGDEGCMITSYDKIDKEILENDCTKVSKIALGFNEDTV